ncbi:MAG: hypothetical protein OXB88_11440 [Bacteriovoracales bacterium]|nr:hypothetical protein [Bacteriovoracales bacterium]
MPFFIFSLLFFLVSSCSLKHDSSKIPLYLDSDGDKVFDWKELGRGDSQKCRSCARKVDASLGEV